MKKISVVCLFVLFFSVFSAFAQETSRAPVDNSEFYVLQVTIDKIFPYTKGYILEYRKNGIGSSRIFLPAEWFARTNKTEGPLKGELSMLLDKKVWPYLTIYYKDGKTDHVRLFVREHSHLTWGSVPSTVSFDANFEGVEEITVVR
ncbi:MAG: hypothetical protein LBB22_06960 [Treponema sp.]|jgi:hypothetical protein|nr:hypothetical protein [Treponema sp.]